jgi:capsular polysaccharide biosynthesis protein
VSAISPPSAVTRDAPLLAPRRVGLGEALRRYPFLLLLPALILAGLGVALALHRVPVYTATAQDVVQPLSPNIAQLPGALQASKDLAANHSRLIRSAEVTGTLAERFDTSSADVEQRVSATPVPDSTIVKIAAEGDSAEDAVALANAAAQEFADYVNALVETDAQAQQVLDEYQDAAARYTRAVFAKRSVQSTDETASSAALVRASAALDAAQLRRQALGAEYQNLVQSHASVPRVDTFVLARSGLSDRWSVLQIYVFAGVVGGLLIGAALATLLANRRRATRAIA